MNHIACPHCDSRIEPSGEPRLIGCRVCGCEFRQEHVKGYVVGVFFIAIAWSVLQHVDGISPILIPVIVFSISSAIFTFFGSRRIIVTAGREFPPAAKPDPPAKVHWLISAVLVLISVILLILIMVWNEAAKQPPPI